MATRNLRFPAALVPASGGASILSILWARCRFAAARLMHRSGLPGTIRPVVIMDALTGQQMTITVDPLFTRISVNGRDYFFNRISGRFDGTGMGCG